MKDGPEHGHRATRELLGPYSLAQLEGVELARVEAHLATCDDWAHELEQLAPLAPLIARVDPAELEPTGVSGLPPDGEARLRSAVRGAQPPGRARRTSRRLAAVTLAAAPAPLEAVSVSSTAPVSASADLVAHTWGVEVQLSGSGFVAGERYRVSVVDDRGRSRRAGEFVGTGDAPMLCRLNSSVLRADAVGFRVVGADGNEVVSSAFPAA